MAPCQPPSLPCAIRIESNFVKSEASLEAQSVLGATHLNIPLPPSNLTRLNRTHLIDPSLRRLKLADCTDLIRRIARDTDIVIALKDELDVADLEGLGAAGFGALAGCGDDLVDELIGDREDGLVCVLVGCRTKWLYV